MKGIDINSIADIPSGTGLGSSSSYTVGLFHALYNYIGKNPSKEQLAKEACELEIDILKEPIGKQDQYAAAYGGLNLIRFLPNGGVDVELINMENKIYEELQNNLLLFFTGTTRNASTVLSDQKNNLLSQKSKFDTIVEMTSLVEKAKVALVQSDLENFGKILDENWQLKKSLSKKISNNHIEDLYSLAKNNGALGGKILGAGGGGFILFYCDKNKQKKLRNALNKLKEVKFIFEKFGTKKIELIS